MNKATARDLLRQFDFKRLFLNELGWDGHDGTLFLKVAEETVALTAVAEKRGMAAGLCESGAGVPPASSSKAGQRPAPHFPDYQTRCRISERR